MPFVSDAQRRKFYDTPSLRKYIPEFEAATPSGAHLPERVSVPHSKHKRRATKARHTALGAMLAQTRSVHR